MGIEERVIAKLNAELGGKVENLSKSKDLVNKYVDNLNNIERKVIFVHINKEFISNYHLTYILAQY